MGDLFTHQILESRSSMHMPHSPLAKKLPIFALR